MRRVLPSSGFGPSGQTSSTQWSWHLTADARTPGGRHVRVDLDADGHPGYLTTAKLLGEVGLLLAEDGATPAARRLPHPGHRARHPEPRPLRARRRPLLGLLLRAHPTFAPPWGGQSRHGYRAGRPSCGVTVPPRCRSAFGHHVEEDVVAAAAHAVGEERRGSGGSRRRSRGSSTRGRGSSGCRRSRARAAAASP